MVQLRLHEWDGKFSEARLRADINQVISHVVCPGRIVIRSHQEREATFYSFGGTLESEVYSEETVFSFRSNAPVLELLPEEETLADLLAEETEVLFARAEARHQFSTQQLLDRLVTAGPEAVYQAVLQSLLPDDEETADTHRHPTSFINMLQSERRWYQKNRRWPNFPRNLETLLQPE